MTIKEFIDVMRTEFSKVSNISDKQRDYFKARLRENNYKYTDFDLEKWWMESLLVS